MLKPIYDLPPHVAGIHAFGEVTELDYENQLLKLFSDRLKKNKQINFILVIETDIKDFASGTWCGNIKIGLKYFFKWNKIAVVTDQKKILGFSDLFNYIIPGQFKKFPLEELEKALKWIAAKN